MHIFLVTYNIMKRKVDTYGRKEKSNHSTKNSPLKFHLDIGKMYINNLNIKTLRFNGYYHFAAVLLVLIIFVYFLMEGDLLYEETRFQSFKRTVKQKKGMQVILFLLKNKLSKEIYILLKKNLVNKMKIFRIPQRTGGFLFRYL